MREVDLISQWSKRHAPAADTDMNGDTIQGVRVHSKDEEVDSSPREESLRRLVRLSLFGHLTTMSQIICRYLPGGRFARGGQLLIPSGSTVWVSMPRNMQFIDATSREAVQIFTCND